MRNKICSFILVLCVCSSVKAQIVSDKKFFKSLPGFKPLAGEYLFIDETEITNLQYKEMLYWFKKQGDTAMYHFMMPDTLVWQKQLTFNAPYVQYYFQHPAYHDYPVVGVNYLQAKKYCEWRAQRIMEYLNLKGTTIEKIRVRLPTEAEWKMAARGTLPETAVYPWEGNGIRYNHGKKKDQGLILANCKRGGNELAMHNYGFVTTNVYSYWPNTLGLYNMAGNVSEWTDNKKAMGGSWNDYPYLLRIDYPHETLDENTTKATLGFRCVLEIVSFKKNTTLQIPKMNAKAIERNFRYIKSDTIQKKQIKLYASAYETTNAQFRAFHAAHDEEQFQVKNEDWLKHTPYAHMTMYGWHPYYDEFPVVNISYEAAQAYCTWLTKTYHSDPKRKYKKVIFRLPSEQEWEFAVGSRKYAWGGPYTLNRKAKYLANFSPLEDQYLAGFNDQGFVYNYPNNDETISRAADGYEFIGRKDIFFSYGLGLYNCTGNVAEMVLEKGVSKGGSWQSNQYQIQTTNRELYTESDATLGFRVFMEIAE